MSLNKRVDRMYADVKAKHENAWLAFIEGFASHLSARDERVLKRCWSSEEVVERRRDERISTLMGAFGAGDEWWVWLHELRAVEEAEGVSFWPSDAPLPPPEPEGLWEYLQEKKEKDLSGLEEEAVVFCLLFLSLARARRQYDGQHESQ